MIRRVSIGGAAAVLVLGLITAAVAAPTSQPAVPQAKPFEDLLAAINTNDAEKFRDCQSKPVRESHQPWKEKLEEAKGSFKARYGKFDVSQFTYLFAGDDAHGDLTISYP